MKQKPQVLRKGKLEEIDTSELPKLVELKVLAEATQASVNEALRNVEELNRVVASYVSGDTKWMRAEARSARKAKPLVDAYLAELPKLYEVRLHGKKVPLIAELRALSREVLFKTADISELIQMRLGILVMIKAVYGKQLKLERALMAGMQVNPDNSEEASDVDPHVE